MSIGVLAILTGLVGSYAFRALLMSDPPPPAEKPQVQIVPLATADLPAGREVRLGDVGLAPLTQQQMIERKFPAGLVMTDPQQVIGRTLKEPVKQGQPFLTTKMYLDGETEDPSSRLRPGFRAYPLVLPPGVAATLAPETFVDITFTTTPRPSKNGSLEIPEVTVPLLQGVEVLGVKMPKANTTKQNVGLDIRRYDGAISADNAIVTLAVTPEDVMTLEAVRGMGTFFISRRPKDEGYVPNAKEVKKTLQDILGLQAPKPAEPAPQPEQPYVTEQYRGGGMRPNAYSMDKLRAQLYYQELRDKGLPPPSQPGQPGAHDPGSPAQAPGIGPGMATGSAPNSVQVTPPKPAELGGGSNPVDKLNNLKSTTDPFSESVKGGHP